MIATRGQREQFIGVMQQEFPETDVLVLCRLILRNAATYGRLQETRVYRELTPFEARLESRTRLRIEELCHRFPGGVTPLFGIGPFGSRIRLRLPSGRTNDGRNDGWAVPAD